jgi:hypothetical protein
VLPVVTAAAASVRCHCQRGCPDRMQSSTCVNTHDRLGRPLCSPCWLLLVCPDMLGPDGSGPSVLWLGWLLTSAPSSNPGRGKEGIRGCREQQCQQRQFHQPHGPSQEQHIESSQVGRALL